MKNILILTNRDISKAPRVIREVEALEGNFNIFILSNFERKSLNARIIKHNHYFYSYNRRLVINFLLKRIISINFLLMFHIFWLKNLILKNKIQYLIIHESELLPLVTFIKNITNVKLIFNAHEYHPLEFEDDKDWVRKEQPVQQQLYNTYIKKIDLLVNVCEPIRQKCVENFNIESIVIPNACKYHDLGIQQNDDGPIKLIHHGSANSSRGIEVIIKAIGEVKGFYLDLMLVGDNEYHKFLVELVSQFENVNIIKPVAFDQITEFINKYDIGIYVLRPKNYNNLVALPNKFFEFIQARLAVLVSPNAEMKRLTEEYDLGWVTSSYEIEDVKITLLKIDRKEIQKYKEKTNIAAKELAAENYYKIYLEKIKFL